MDRNKNKKSDKKFKKFKNTKLKFNKGPKSSELENREIDRLKNLYENINPKDVKKFGDFPLSKKTLKGLKESQYFIPTDIQKESIGYALQEKDILGAAITGSGKTLAFLIPILEKLYIKKWTRLDGLGALIISPTRELAYQTFNTLKKVGSHHDFSVALIIGGKNLKFERRRMDQINIIICTPGRLLQHMDENPLFDCSSLQILVLDEADRILDLGFEKTMNAIIENFPAQRQTLLFSATQTKSVRDLARLSLTSPVYVAPLAQSDITTPKNLKQNYVVIELHEKLTMLWSFIRNHLKQKIIIFMASCKQVKFVTEMFTKLRAGTSVLGLYGTLHQDRRVAVYEEFVRKSNAVLICTDIASRGLDFPVVNWVIQLDCPEDSVQYIHRAGRTARHTAKGESLLVLLPSEEEAMISELKEKKIEINKIFIDPKKMFSPRAKMEALLAQNADLKATAQRAFLSYFKSVFLMKNKQIFKIKELDEDAFALSLGLAKTPRVKFLEKIKINERMKMKRDEKISQDDNSDDDEEDEDEEEEEEEEENEGDHGVKANENEDNKPLFNLNSSDEESDDDFLKVKQRHEISENSESDEDENSDEDHNNLEEKPTTTSSKKKSKPLTKAAIAKKLTKKQIKINKKTVFNDDGEEVMDPTKQLQSEMAKKLLEEDDEVGGIDIEKAKLLLREEDRFDKERFREIKKRKRREMKMKLKEKEEDEDEQDDFGSDDSLSEGHDFSWLPEPDKVYGKKSNSEQNEMDSNDDEERDNDEEDEEEEDESSDDEEIDQKFHKPPTHLLTTSKHKNKEYLENPVKKKQKTIDPSELSVNEAESLAMKLLNHF